MAISLGPLIVSIHGTVLTEETKERLSHPAVGGVILFTRNFSDVEQMSSLIQSIRAIRSPQLLVTVDHEGGRVQRFRHGFTVIPSARDIGYCYDVNPQEAYSLAMDVGIIIGYELKNIGIDLTYAPVLDLDYRANDVIGDRSFHRDPVVVSELAGLFIKGLSLSGIRCVGKHYPTHGYASEDSHVLSAVDGRDFDALASDLQPYRILRYELSAVMPGWVCFPKIDRFPACLSSFWLNYLREDMAFRQPIISDDLGMEAASFVPECDERLYKTLEAGCDMACLCDVLSGSPDIDAVLSSLDLSRLSDCQCFVDTLRAANSDSELCESHYRAAKVRLSEFSAVRLLPSLS